MKIITICYVDYFFRYDNIIQTWQVPNDYISGNMGLGICDHFKG